MDFDGLDVEARVARWFVRPAFCLGRYQISGVIGPNVYAYVQQNPWTKWDPEGLTELSEIQKNFNQGLAQHGVAWALTVGTAQAFGSFINPFSSNSPFVQARAEFHEGTQHALSEISKSDVPAPLKVITKFGIGVGTAGDKMNPLNAVADITQAAKTVAEKGVVETGKAMVSGFVYDIKNNPEAVLGEAFVGAAIGNAFKTVSAGKTGPLRGPCFAEGTPVATPNGIVAIEEIKQGDAVLAFDFQTHQVIEKRVVKLKRGDTHCWIHVSIEGGDELKATRYHPFWVESSNAWIQAMDLERGMLVRLKSGCLARIVSVSAEILDHPEPTFNFEVADLHNYFVGRGVLVHNDAPSADQLLGLQRANKSPYDSAQTMQLEGAKAGRAALQREGLWGKGFRLACCLKSK